MALALENDLNEFGKSLEQLKQKVNEAKEDFEVDKKSSKSLKEKDHIIAKFDKVLEKILDELGVMYTKQKNIEKAFGKKLKKVYANPYYRRVTKDHEKHVGEGGPFNYSREAIHPYHDSLFL